MNDLVDTTEMYLKAIVELEEESITPLRARISERLGHSGPTVSQTVARMERDGLLSVGADRHLILTDEGREHAVQVMRKHRLAERLLCDVIGLEWELVHDEACRWEHVMSEQVETKLVSLLADTDTSPYGNPIPGLGALGVEAPEAPPAVSLGRLLGEESDGTTRDVEVSWFGEPIQVDVALLRQLADAGIMPGEAVTATVLGTYISLAKTGAQSVLDLPEEVAAHVFIKEK